MVRGRSNTKVHSNRTTQWEVSLNSYVLCVLNRHLLSAAQHLGVGQVGFHCVPCTGYPSRML
jgi:hypothetical protein